MTVKNSLQTNRTSLTKGMAALLAQEKYRPRVLRRGETLQGSVREVTAGRVLIDIGAKSEGLVSGEEYDAVREFVKTLRAGTYVPVTIITPETPEGTALVSLRGAARTFAWEKVAEAVVSQRPLQARVIHVARGGITVELVGISCFIPTIELGKYVREASFALVGKNIAVRVLNFDRDKERIIVSERAVSEKEEIARVQELVKSISVGERLVGEVTKIAPFGAFIEIAKDNVLIEGLVHISELSWEKIDDPSSVVSVGDTVEVVVLGEREGRLALSLKRAGGDPWQGAEQRFPPDTPVSGTVTKIMDRNIVVEVEPGIEGIIQRRTLPPGAEPRVGERIACFVEKVEEEKRRMMLTVRLTTKPVGYK